MHVPKAFVVLKKNTKNTAKVKAEIKSLCKRELSVYAMPKDFEFRDDLPKTLYGKIDYRKIEKEENKE